MAWLILVGAVCVFVVMWLIGNQNQKVEAERFDIGRSAPFSYVSDDGNTGIGLNFTTHELYLKVSFAWRKLSFSQLISSELKRNDTIVSRINRGSQIASGLVGAVAFGAPGAIVGALSGSSNTTTLISKLTLEVRLDDPSCPIVPVAFYDGPPITTNQALNRIRLAEEMQARLDLAIRQPAAT